MRRAFAALAGLTTLMAAAPALSQTPVAPAAAPAAPAAPADEATKTIPAASPNASVETTTIGDLVDNPKTKAVLQQDMPELLSYDGLDQIKGMTMRDISKYPQANLDQTKLEKLQKDLDAITP
jgi:para-nitrobenzyl esterase